MQKPGAPEVINPTEPEAEEPFTYPAESTQGELIVHCDGRTYAADVGERITYVVELKAAELFENIQLLLKYSDAIEIFEPEETEDKMPCEISMPNIRSPHINYNAKVTEGKTKIPAIKALTSNIRGEDFRKRKVLLQLDFIVTKPGDINLDLLVEEMTIKGDGTRTYFTRGEQIIFDGIEFYEYIIVH